MTRLTRLAALALTLSVTATAGATPPPVQPARDRARPVTPAEDRPQATCANNLKLTAITYRIVERTGPKTGEVEIAAHVKNVGVRDYTSPIEKQSVVFYENGTLVQVRPFGGIARGAVLTEVYRRMWDASSGAQGGSPPHYRARIVFADDNQTDDNPNNNDCKRADDLVEKSGDKINALFE